MPSVNSRTITYNNIDFVFTKSQLAKIADSTYSITITRLDLPMVELVDCHLIFIRVDNKYYSLLSSWHNLLACLTSSADKSEQWFQESYLVSSCKSFGFTIQLPVDNIILICFMD